MAMTVTSRLRIRVFIIFPFVLSGVGIYRQSLTNQNPKTASSYSGHPSSQDTISGSIYLDAAAINTIIQPFPIIRPDPKRKRVRIQVESWLPMLVAS
jgi:hypothetical protein